jgi:hypothetical protein
MRKAANEKKSKRICYSVLIVPHYEGRARQFRVSRFAIYGVVAACVIILSAVGFVVAQNYSLRNTVAQYKGMSLDEVVRLQTAQLDAANEALTKSSMSATSASWTSRCARRWVSRTSMSRLPRSSSSARRPRSR